jgi:Reverse transcriptase (RNA-dependent DNA polymerase)
LTLKHKLLEHGFTTSDADPSLFLLSSSTGKRVMILIYVDDCLIAGQKREWVTDTVKLVQSLFEARDMGEPTDFVGMRIARDRSAGTLRLHQEPYVAKLLDTFGVAGATSICLPLKLALTPDGEPLSMECHVQYPSLIGSLMHLANCTRPDIAQAVSSLARFLKSPTTLHWDAAQQLLRYLVGTRAAGLCYRTGGAQKFLGYCDANHGGDVATRRSTTGFVFLLHGAAVAWQSKLQPTVALSTTEAEYQAAGMAAREALWFRKPLPELGEATTGPTLILCDSESVRVCATP